MALDGYMIGLPYKVDVPATQAPDRRAPRTNLHFEESCSSGVAPCQQPDKREAGRDEPDLGGSGGKAQMHVRPV
jgi:hypothetical protein